MDKFDKISEIFYPTVRKLLLSLVLLGLFSLVLSAGWLPGTWANGDINGPLKMHEVDFSCPNENKEPLTNEGNLSNETKAYMEVTPDMRYCWNEKTYPKSIIVNMALWYLISSVLLNQKKKFDKRNE